MNELHFHVTGRTLADMQEAVFEIADRFFGYDTSKYNVVEEEEDRLVAIAEERPYKYQIDAHLSTSEVNKDNARYSWAMDSTFRANVRCWIPMPYGDF